MLEYWSICLLLLSYRDRQQPSKVFFPLFIYCHGLMRTFKWFFTLFISCRAVTQTICFTLFISCCAVTRSLMFLKFFFTLFIFCRSVTMTVFYSVHFPADGFLPCLFSAVLQHSRSFTLVISRREITWTVFTLFIFRRAVTRTAFYPVHFPPLCHADIFLPCSFSAVL